MAPSEDLYPFKDEREFMAFVESNAKLCMYTSLWRIRSKIEMEDIFSECYIDALKAVRKVDRSRSEIEILSYIRDYITQACYKVFRLYIGRRGRKSYAFFRFPSVLSEFSVYEGDDETIPEVVDYRSFENETLLRIQLERMRKALPKSDRHLFDLILKGHTPTEIAGMLGVTPGRIFQRVRDIRSRLCREVEEDLAQDVLQKPYPTPDARPSWR